MAEDQRAFVDVIMDDLDTHPMCSHGPTLLFRRKNKFQDRKFYACAACRDRKLCSYFHWADEVITDKKKKIWELERKKFLTQRNYKELFAECNKFKDCIGKEHIAYCHDCNLFEKHSKLGEHKSHDVHLNITYHQITHPTELLKPLEANKKEAQYLFSMTSTKTIVNIARNNNIQSVICIGAPRIHEYIQTNCNEGLTSLLLDIDWRYNIFYGPEEFCWFNVFNNYFFFGETSKNIFTYYLQNNGKKAMMMIIDPPFGGRLEPLAHTIKSIQKLHKELNPDVQTDIAVLLIYPYFMENHITASCPDFQMMDYKVTYDNHPEFSQGLKARKQGSPVRIFTNIDPNCVPLPAEEGYKYCKLCKKWVSQENRHCEFCEKCTSKNGVTYVHCFQCHCCVKPSWKHCDKCQRCCLVPHKCGSFMAIKVCYKCGEVGHKKYACPNDSHDKSFTIEEKLNNKRKKGNKTSNKKHKEKKFCI